MLRITRWRNVQGKCWRRDAFAAWIRARNVWRIAQMWLNCGLFANGNDEIRGLFWIGRRLGVQFYKLRWRKTGLGFHNNNVRKKKQENRWRENARSSCYPEFKLASNDFGGNEKNKWKKFGYIWIVAWTCANRNIKRNEIFSTNICSSTTSRREPGMMVLENFEGVMKTKTHMCRYDMTQMTANGPMCAKKPAEFLTQFATITNQLSKCCTRFAPTCRSWGRRNLPNHDLPRRAMPRRMPKIGRPTETWTQLDSPISGTSTTSTMKSSRVHVGTRNIAKEEELMEIWGDINGTNLVPHLVRQIWPT